MLGVSAAPHMLEVIPTAVRCDKEDLMSAQIESEQKRGSILRRSAALALLCLAVTMTGAATLANDVDTKTAENVLTFESVRMRILQTETTPTGEAPVADGSSVRADKGEISRNVRVENTGSADMFVRVRPVMVAQDAQGNQTTGEEVDRHVEYTLNTGDGPTQWTYQVDEDGVGWYYYNSLVTPEGDTSITNNLMTALEFNGDFYKLVGAGGQFELTIDAQGVQSKNQEPGTTALTAVGWPSTEEEGE